MTCLPDVHPLKQMLRREPEVPLLKQVNVMLPPVSTDVPSSLKFLHLTFQEYFTAGYLARIINTKGWQAYVSYRNTRSAKVEQFLGRQAWDPVWRNVLVLLAGQLADPMPLLQMLARQTSPQTDPCDDAFRYRLGLTALFLREASADVAERHSQFVQQMADAVFSLWWHHAMHETLAAVPHLTEALPILAQLGLSKGETTWLDWVCQQARSEDTRLCALLALEAMGATAGRHASAVSVLKEAVHDDEPQIREHAERALSAISMGVQWDADWVMEMTSLGCLLPRDTSSKVRTYMCTATLQAEDTRSALASALSSTDSSTRIKAENALSAMGEAVAHHHDLLSAMVSHLCKRLRADPLDLLPDEWNNAAWHHPDVLAATADAVRSTCACAVSVPASDRGDACSNVVHYADVLCALADAAPSGVCLAHALSPWVDQYRPFCR